KRVMAISVAAAAAASMVPRTSPSCSLPRSEPACFSSARRFWLGHRISGFRKRCLVSSRRPRSLSPVASKKQTFSSFEDLLEKTDKPVLVDFYATWCGPCQFMVPILEQVSSILVDKIQVVKIDTEKYPEVANKYRIEALPTFILFKDGKPLDRFEGALGAEQLVQRIEASL
ncbi:hypothetical protein M569_08641, partial [Genlisea aurea]